MISDAQHRAIRAYVLACLNLDLPAGMTALDAEQVQWELQDFPRGAGAWCSLQVVAAVPTGDVPERVHRSIPDPDNPPPATILERTIRQSFEVTVSVTLRSQRSDTAPSWGSDAGLRLRRVVLGWGASVHRLLSAAGCPIRRAGGLRDLSTLQRGSQWESTAQVDLVLLVMAQVVERPGWIESIAGTITLEAPEAPGGGVVVPYREPPE